MRCMVSGRAPVHLMLQSELASKEDVWFYRLCAAQDIDLKLMERTFPAINS